MTTISLNNWLKTNVYTKTNEISQQRLRNQSKAYIDGLTKWQRFILFNYTLRSAYVNRLLKDGIHDGYERSLLWARDFLSRVKENRLVHDPEAYVFYQLGPLNISKIIQSKTPKTINLQYDIVRYMMYQYIAQLQSILLNSPILNQDVYLYKVTKGIYPGLPKKAKWRMQNPIPIKQKPFNSTTLGRKFNFTRFYDAESACCYFVIYVPKGNRILHISEHIHGFPYQDEVLLPFGNTLNIFHKEKTNQIYSDYKKLDIQRRPFIIGPVTILHPDKNKNIKIKNTNITTYLAQYIRPTGTDCIDTKTGLRFGQVCNRTIPTQPNSFKYNQEKIGYLPGKFRNNIPITSTFIQYIPSFLSFANSNDLVVFEFKNVLGIPIVEAWKKGVIPYNHRLSSTALIPGTGLVNLGPLSNKLRIIALIDRDVNGIPAVAKLLKDNKLNITTVGTVLSNRTLSYSEAMNIIHKKYGGRRIFYIGSDMTTLSGINTPNTYKYYVNILNTAVSVVPEQTRNMNKAIYNTKSIQVKSS